MTASLDCDFTVLEWDDNRKIVAHTCDWENDHLKSKEAVYPQMKEASNPAPSVEVYLKQLDSMPFKDVTHSASVINNLLCSVKLNEPGFFNLNEEDKLILQGEKDLPRITYIKINGRVVYDNKLIKGDEALSHLIDVLSRLVDLDVLALNRLSILMSQASMGYGFAELTTKMTYKDVSTEYHWIPIAQQFVDITKKDNQIIFEKAHFFKLISIKEGLALRYIKVVRVYRLLQDELKSGIIRLSSASDQFHPIRKLFCDTL